MKKKWFVFAAAASVTCGACALVPKWLEKEMEKRLDVVDVATASHDVRPRTVLSEEDVVMVRVPSSCLDESVYRTKEEVLGKITVRYGFIPEGSFFYKSALEDVSDVSDAVLLDLKEHQVLAALRTDAVALGANALCEGQKVDLYVTIKDSSNETKVGSLFNNVRILGVKDHRGLNLDDPDSTHEPYIIQFALSDEALPLFQMAQEIGEISYYATSFSYDEDAECQIDWESDMIEVLGFSKEKAIE